MHFNVDPTTLRRIPTPVPIGVYLFAFAGLYWVDTHWWLELRDATATSILPFQGAIWCCHLALVAMAAAWSSIATAGYGLAFILASVDVLIGLPTGISHPTRVVFGVGLLGLITVFAVANFLTSNKVRRNGSLRPEQRIGILPAIDHWASPLVRAAGSASLGMVMLFAVLCPRFPTELATAPDNRDAYLRNRSPERVQLVGYALNPVLLGWLHFTADLSACGCASDRCIACWQSDPRHSYWHHLNRHHGVLVFAPNPLFSRPSSSHYDRWCKTATSVLNDAVQQYNVDNSNTLINSGVVAQKRLVDRQYIKSFMHGPEYECGFQFDGHNVTCRLHGTNGVCSERFGDLTTALSWFAAQSALPADQRTVRWNTLAMPMSFAANLLFAVFAIALDLALFVQIPRSIWHRLRSL